MDKNCEEFVAGVYRRHQTEKSAKNDTPVWCLYTSLKRISVLSALRPHSPICVVLKEVSVRTVMATPKEAVYACKLK